MDNNLLKQVRALKIYVAVLSLLFLTVFFLAFKENGNKNFTTIDVERINIVEKDGKIKMVIANKEMTPSAINNGRILDTAKERGPGIIIYNDDGDECGGYLFDNYGSIFSMDQYKQDQIASIEVQNDDNGKPIRAGFWVAPKSNTMTSDAMDRILDSLYSITDKQQKKEALQRFWKGADLHNKAFMGKTREDDIGLFLFDKNSKTRLRAFVDTLGNPKMQFLDDKGKIIYSIPQ